MRGLSDRAIAWLFITPTILLLLAINIFPLIWTIYLSFTNYRANRPNARGAMASACANYERILTDADSGTRCRSPRISSFWTIALQMRARLRRSRC